MAKTNIKFVSDLCVSDLDRIDVNQANVKPTAVLFSSLALQ